MNRLKKMSLSLLAAFTLLCPYPASALTASAATQAPSAANAAATFEFSEKRVTLPVGETVYIPINGSQKYKNISYKSSKPDVISVDQEGNITVLQKGIATITAIAGKVYSKCVVQGVIGTDKVTLSEKTFTMSPRQRYTLKATLTPSNTSFRTLLWSSSSPSVASVRNGIVTAKNKGMTIIAASTEDGVLGYCVCVVKVAVESVTFKSERLFLNQGSTYGMNAAVLPEDADDKTLTWSSDHPEIVSVDENGTLKALSAGTAVITATAANGVSASAAVEVYSSVTSVSIPSDLTLGQNETFTISPVILPENASNKNLTWSSSNSNIVSVSNGKLTAVSLGKATITARTNNGKSASCVVTVMKEPSKVTLAPNNQAIGVGESYRLTTTLPEYTASHSVAYASTNPSVCAVSNNGTVTGIKPGSANISVTLYNGVTANIKIYVKAAPVAITLDQDSLTLGQNEPFRLYTHIDGSHASKNRYFSSSNENIVSVDASGNLSAKGIGTATVTASTYNGVTASCAVTVKNAPTSVSFDRTSVTLADGESAKLSTILPSGQASHALSYASANTSVCTISSDGTVTARSAGVTTVSVTAYNGKKGVCTVNVGKAPDSISLYVNKRIMRPGQTFRLKYYFNEKGTSSGVSYASSNTNVCTVTPEGTVSAKAVGSAVISVTTANKKTAYCQITVTNDTALLRTDPSYNLPLQNNFTPLPQYPELPTGCEVTALTSVLNYYGFNVDKLTMSDEYLDKGNAWETDFRVAFAGEPRSVYSYGCYAPVIVEAANEYLTEQHSSLRATELKGMEFDNLFNFTENGIPVIVWTTIDLQEGHYSATWDTTVGTTVTWYANEHCMALLGCVGSTVYTADPTSGTIAAYNKDLFRTRYKELFSQAVVIQ